VIKIDFDLKPDFHPDLRDPAKQVEGKFAQAMLRAVSPANARELCATPWAALPLLDEADSPGATAFTLAYPKLSHNHRFIVSVSG
jgi:hypothetical protein